MPYCERCGAWVHKDSRFCQACGAKVRRAVTEEFSVSAEDLIRKVKELINEGNIRRIVVKNEKGEILLEIPATIGVVGAIVAPYLAALGVAAALATNCTIVVERKV